MTDRHTIRLNSPEALAKARKGLDWCAERLGEGWELLLVRDATKDQRAKMWATCGDIAKQMPVWRGTKMRKDDYKQMFIHSLRREINMLPTADGDGFFPSGNSSKDLTVSECSDLLELINAWRAREGVALPYETERDAA